jgi:CHAD domain-containing protein
MSNGIHAPAAVSLFEKQSRLVFQRMGRQIGKLIKSASADNVHKFRTHSRRVEALVSELAPQNGNQKKLLKLLSRLRKKAGKVRDLDVQIAFLKQLKVPDRQHHRAQLLEWLDSEQSRRKKKLEKTMDDKTVGALRKRLRRVQSEIKLDGIDPMFDPLKIAHTRLPDPGTIPLSEKMLHTYRVEAKKARYLAELAPQSPERLQFLEELKKAQDAIGEWHDVLKLKDRAEQWFGGVSDSSLVSVLQNIGRAKFRRATSALVTAITMISKDKKAPEPISSRKSTASAPEMQHDAVA